MNPRRQIGSRRRDREPSAEQRPGHQRRRRRVESIAKLAETLTPTERAELRDLLAAQAGLEADAGEPEAQP